MIYVIFVKRLIRGNELFGYKSVRMRIGRFEFNSMSSGIDVACVPCAMVQYRLCAVIEIDEDHPHTIYHSFAMSDRQRCWMFLLINIFAFDAL